MPSTAEVTRTMQILRRSLSSWSNYRNQGMTPSSTMPRIGQTSVFYQSGLKIRELPMVVKKVNDVLHIAGMDRFQTVERPKRYAASSRADDAHAAEIAAGFNRCYSVSGIFKLLETIPVKEVTPSVAIHALRKIMAIEVCATSKDLNFQQALAMIKDPNDLGERERSFLRLAFINMLLGIVYKSKEPQIILEGLQIVGESKFPGDKDHMCEQALLCVSEGGFSLKQICEVVQALAQVYPNGKSRELTDKLWMGILDKADELSAANMSAVFATLPHLKCSRDIVLKMLEDRAEDFWQQFQTRDILEILRVLKDMNLCSERVMQVISQWLAVHVQSVKESELLAIVYCFQKLEYIDDTIIRTMEKYMRLRGCRIKEKDLVATICDYCLDFRVRSKPILEGAGEYFLEHGRTLTTPQLFTITRIFGELDFHPPNGFKFWEIVEHVLEMKFIEFPPKEIICLLLSFIYIERFPLNFVRKIFNPFFMERVHNQSEADISLSRCNLKLFDVAMKLEARNYTGPYLPKETHYRSLSEDPRITKTVSELFVPLIDVVGDATRIGKSVVLSYLPLNSIYIVDFMIYPSASASLLRFGFKTNNSQNVAVLILLPEHFSRDGNHLTGPQAMRQRQLKSMGFKVMPIQFSHVAKLRMYPKQLQEFLAEEYYKVLKET